MKAWHLMQQLLIRYRYPVSMPEEVASALGIPVSNRTNFQEFLAQLCSPSCCPTTLNKYMPREEAEEAFRSARRKERFTRNSLFSYYFSEGWVEFVLQFDEQSRLRRIYLHNKAIPQDEGIEIQLR